MHELLKNKKNNSLLINMEIEKFHNDFNAQLKNPKSSFFQYRIKITGTKKRRWKIQSKIMRRKLFKK